MSVFYLLSAVDLSVSMNEQKMNECSRCVVSCSKAGKQKLGKRRKKDCAKVVEEKMRMIMIVMIMIPTKRQKE